MPVKMKGKVEKHSEIEQPKVKRYFSRTIKYLQIKDPINTIVEMTDGTYKEIKHPAMVITFNNRQYISHTVKEQKLIENTAAFKRGEVGLLADIEK